MKPEVKSLCDRGSSVVASVNRNLEHDCHKMTEISESMPSTEASFRRKKKKSFLSKAKKFGKSGRFGKGRQIDKDTYEYFLRILEQASI